MMNLSLGKKFVFIILLALSSQISAAKVSFKLDHIDTKHIDALTDKYCEQFSHARKMKALKYSAVGIGISALASWFVYDQFLKDQFFTRKPDAKEANNVNKDVKLQVDDLRLKELSEELDLRKNPLKAVMYRVRDGLIIAVSGVIIAKIYDLCSAGKDACKSFLFSGKISDVQHYMEKQVKIRDLLSKLAALPELSKDQGGQSDENSVLFEIAMSDIFLTHRTMIFSIEDILAFIKFLTILAFEKESYQFAAVVTNCEIISNEFNSLSDKMALFANHDQKADKDAFIKEYAQFCRKFTKFVCDCGVSLYGQDFLQK